jgi:hypothetical protein
MPRLAGDTPGYKFALIDKATNKPTSHEFELRSVTSIIENVVAKPFGAGMWTGWRNALEDVAKEWNEAPGDTTGFSSADGLEERLKSKNLDPNKRLKGQADRGQTAHDVLEYLAKGRPDLGTMVADKEAETQGTLYGQAVLDWWRDTGMDSSTRVQSELPVWSLSHSYAGTLDLLSDGCVTDLKTHKPAAGFTKRGAAYLSDIIQVRAYRTALSEMGQSTTSNCILIARENGKYLEDTREVPEEFWFKVLELDRMILEGGW